MKKLKGSLNVRFINRHFFPNQPEFTINEGECFLWAYLAYRLYKDVELWDMGSHAFVRSKKTGKFYDSERPKGVDDWKELPATNWGKGCGCGRCQQPARKFKTAGKFRQSWIGMMKRFEVDYDKINKQIFDLIQEYNP
jgi:hypothetical protein